MDSHTTNLPVDVVECILSFLSVPTLCRMRVVCKEWNELTNNTSFHALCDKNGKNEDYLFFWGKNNYIKSSCKNISQRFGAPFHFFDSDMERWHSIPSIQVQQTCGPNEKMVHWNLRIDNGLVTEVKAFYGTEWKKSLCIWDPIAKTSMELPSPNLSLYHLPACDLDLHPSLVIVVDQITHSYKVFVFKKIMVRQLAWVLESGTRNWRLVGGLPQHLDDMIAFQNTAFASSTTVKDWCQLGLFRYQVEGNTFAKVWEMNFPRFIMNSKLLVHHNRLFVLVTTRLSTSMSFVIPREHLLDPNEACFETCQDAEGDLFEMYEILLDEGIRAKPIVQFTEDALHAIWGGDKFTNFRFMFPCLDSKGSYSSIVLMQQHSGEMRRFHLATGTVDVLPTCPFSTTIRNMEDVTSTFDAKTMPLSLRDVLKHVPPTV